MTSKTTVREFIQKLQAIQTAHEALGHNDLTMASIFQGQPTAKYKETNGKPATTAPFGYTKSGKVRVRRAKGLGERPRATRAKNSVAPTSVGSGFPLFPAT